MTKTSSIHVRVEPKVKKEAEKILDKLGMTSAEAINVYLKQIILHNGLPFEVRIPELSDDFKEAIKEVEEIQKYPKKYKKYDSVEELMKDLDGEDEKNE